MMIILRVKIQLMRIILRALPLDKARVTKPLAHLEDYVVFVYLKGMVNQHPSKRQSIVLRRKNGHGKCSRSENPWDKTKHVT